MDNKDFGVLITIEEYCTTIAELIERFGEDYDTFTDDKAYYNSVSMCVFQIGELSGKLSEQFREETKTQIPWGMIRGMRNLFAHTYGAMDVDVIWETALSDIPFLREFCRKMISEYKP